MVSKGRPAGGSIWGTAAIILFQELSHLRALRKASGGPVVATPSISGMARGEIVSNFARVAAAFGGAAHESAIHETENRSESVHEEALAILKAGGDWVDLCSRTWSRGRGS